MASRIEDYAMIGDGRTAALVSRDGSIDWLCLPRFDADPCCAALLGTQRHGYWRIAPYSAATVQRRYLGETLVLATEFTGAEGAVRVTDCMPVGTDQRIVVRRVTGLDGTLRMRCELALRFDFGLLPPRMRRHDDALVAIAGPDLVAVRAPIALEPDNDGVMTAAFDVAAGQELTFVMSYGPSHHAPPGAIDADKAIRDTLAFWNGWARQFRRETPWRDAVMRSLVTLKALSYHPTGGIVAAATTSLPEMPGGELNWDYRYCWLRDASFTLSALLNAGYHEEAVAWRDWMLRAIAAAPDRMRIMYRVDGSRRINEWQVGWLPGYDDAAPVRSVDASLVTRLRR
ncbi:MAG TPA: glycoside hydrolase family 15 protein [Acetobacteraceae bacterium]|jgi:GH15 family glucan-1,4-alpha-glucosidase|nr:glycoside hydrolase family 15 protein [Acetobacteraceae bacterium]